VVQRGYWVKAEASPGQKCGVDTHTHMASAEHEPIMGCLHDPANVQQTSSKCIQNTRDNAGRLLDVCMDRVNNRSLGVDPTTGSKGRTPGLGAKAFRLKTIQLLIR